MKKIIYFHRNKKAGFSIEKVSKPYIDKVDDKIVLNVPEHRASPLSVLKNLIFIFKNRQRGTIHHITGDIHYGILALLGHKTVLTVHDTGTVDFNKAGCLKKMITRFFWFKIPLKLATKVVCISEETKKNVARYTARKDIVVIPNSVDTAIKFQPKGMLNKTPRLLIVGTNPNKNLELQIKALADIDCELVIIGKLSDNQKKLLTELNINYINLQGLSDEELYEEYYKADIVLFCSLFEGFGMPVIEAQQAGCPVICSDIPVLKEVGGDGALYVDPSDEISMRNGVNEVLKNEALRRLLIEKGRENVARYDIERIFPLWTKLYENDVFSK